MPRSSSGTTPRLRGRPVIVGAGVVLAASYEAKACGVRTAMGGAQARRLCPQAVVVPPRMSAYAEASRAVFEVFAQTTPAGRGALDRRGVPRRPRPRADLGLADARSPRGCGARSASASACRSRSGWPPPSSSPRWPAGWRSRTACSWCRRAASSPSSTRSRWSGCGASGPVTARKLRGAGPRDGRRGRRSSPRRRSSRSWAGPPGATSTPSPTTAIRGGCGDGAAGARWAPSARSAARRGRAGDLDAILVGLVDRLARRLRAARRVCRTVTLRLRFGDFSRATRSHTLPEATAHTQPILATGEGPARPGHADDRAPRASRSSGVALANLDDDGAIQLALPLDRERRRRPRRRGRRHPRSVRIGRDHPRRARRAATRASTRSRCFRTEVRVRLQAVRAADHVEHDLVGARRRSG